MKWLDRHTYHFFLKPEEYIEYGPTWRLLNIELWSENDYEYTTDKWWGIKDYVRDPYSTLKHGRGDCEDYALVALCWCAAKKRSNNLGVAMCFKSEKLLPQHMVAYDDKRVYSSGDIVQTDLHTWVEQSKYDAAIPRPVPTDRLRTHR